MFVPCYFTLCCPQQRPCKESCKVCVRNKCVDREGLGLRVTGVTVANKFSKKTFYYSGVSVSVFKYLKINWDNFLTFCTYLLTYLLHGAESFLRS
jgi:hypothetical protein